MTNETASTDKLRAFRALYKEHAEDMVILAYLLLRDPEGANKIVEDVLMKVWDEDNFQHTDITTLYNQVRQACQNYY